MPAWAICVPTDPRSDRPVSAEDQLRIQLRGREESNADLRIAAYGRNPRWSPELERDMAHIMYRGVEPVSLND